MTHLKRKVVLGGLLLFASYIPAVAMMTVIDPANIEQTTETAAQSVLQTQKQIEQYQTQLEQYENEIKNTVAPSAFLWGKVNDTINNLLFQIDTLKAYKKQYGSLDNYLNQFQDVDYYRSSPCYKSGGCTEAQKQELIKMNEEKSAILKKSTDSAVRGMDQQFTDLQKDSDRLKDLQANTQTAKGRLEAIQYANQLASEQASQLMQIRALLLAQQDLAAKQMQVKNDQKAQAEAANATFWAMPKSKDAYVDKNPTDLNKFLEYHGATQ